MRAMKKAALLSAFLLVGCADYSWFGQAESPSSRQWNGIVAEDEEAVAELESCRQQARAMIQRDSLIDRDIGAAGLIRDDDADLALMRNMDEFETERRFNRIVADCMRQRGYGTPAAETPAE